MALSVSLSAKTRSVVGAPPPAPVIDCGSFALSAGTIRERSAGVKAVSRKSPFIHARKSLSCHEASSKGTWWYCLPSRHSALRTRIRSSSLSTTVQRMGSGPFDGSPSCS